MDITNLVMPIAVTLVCSGSFDHIPLRSYPLLLARMFFAKLMEEVKEGGKWA